MGHCLYHPPPCLSVSGVVICLRSHSSVQVVPVGPNIHCQGRRFVVEAGSEEQGYLVFVCLFLFFIYFFACHRHAAAI